MIALTLDEATKARVSFLPLRDYYDERRWRAAALAAVQAQAAPGAHIALIGHAKDATSEYLHGFPDWTLLPAPAYGEINWSGLAFDAAQFATVTGLDVAAWREEFKLHDELFTRLAQGLPAALTQTRRALEERFESAR